MTELIPRGVLFGYPEKAAPALSPDGTRIAYLAPHAGTLALWTRTVGNTDDRVVASDPARPIRTAYWSPDGARVLYLQDAGGGTRTFTCSRQTPTATANRSTSRRTRMRACNSRPTTRTIPIACSSR